MEEKAANIILDEGVKFSIKTTGIRRIFSKKKTFVIKPLYPGTIVKISGMLYKLDVTDLKSEQGISGQLIGLIGKNAITVCKMVSICTLRKPLNIIFFHWLRWRFFMWNATCADLQNLMDIITVQTNGINFLNTIVSLKGQNILAPRKQTSPIGTGETIAPGVSLEPQ